MIVHRPERKAELFDEMKSMGIEPKVLRLFCDNADAPPSLILVEGRQGAAAGMEVRPTLYRESGEYGGITGMLIN